MIVYVCEGEQFGPGRLCLQTPVSTIPSTPAHGIPGIQARPGKNSGLSSAFFHIAFPLIFFSGSRFLWPGDPKNMPLCRRSRGVVKKIWHSGCETEEGLGIAQNCRRKSRITLTAAWSRNIWSPEATSSFLKSID